LPLRQPSEGGRTTPVRTAVIENQALIKKGGVELFITILPSKNLGF